MNAYDNTQQLRIQAGNKSATLGTSTGQITLAAGIWEIWASQACQLQVQTDVTSTAIGTDPQIWPANYVVGPYHVQTGSTEYLLHRANIAEYSTAGVIYCNKTFPVAT
jgi:hypothetical protein